MGFKKAQPMQAAVKMSMYGTPGSGKTFSALLFAEGIAKHTGKRIAFVDTERGTDFYAMNVASREPHPEAFDFDALYTRSLTETLKDCKALNPAEHSVIIIDSISHLWDAAIAAYTGQKTIAGTIPMWAWSKIKAPYRELMKFLIDSPFHVFVLGRQANVFEEDASTGESKSAGVKMRAEGETAYEMHVCLHMISERTTQKGKKTVVNREQVIAAFGEKDRTGLLTGRLIEWPTFDVVIAPMLGLMGSAQAQMQSEEEAATVDAAAIAEKDRQKAAKNGAHVEESKQDDSWTKEVDSWRHWMSGKPDLEIFNKTLPDLAAVKHPSAKRVIKEWLGHHANERGWKWNSESQGYEQVEPTIGGSTT